MTIDEFGAAVKQAEDQTKNPVPAPEPAPVESPEPVVNEPTPTPEPEGFPVIEEREVDDDLLDFDGWIEKDRLPKFGKRSMYGVRFSDLAFGNGFSKPFQNGN